MRLATFILALICATPVLAQGQNCAIRNIVVERLAEIYGETRQAIGIGSGQNVVEVFASHETGTSTITVTAPSGMMCLVASGQSFERLYEQLPPKEEDL